jgi:hypothetical protein
VTWQRKKTFFLSEFAGMYYLCTCFNYEIQVSQVMKTLLRNGLKGQQAHSPGQRPGSKEVSIFALQGQKPICRIVAFALAGRWLRTFLTQGVLASLW